jgi:CRP/FNR family transcriptional regulator, cyclic AMP receptor protein
MRTKTLLPKEEGLRNLTIFRGLDHKQLRQVASLVDEARRPAGWSLTTQGRGGQQAFIIVEGRATVSVNGQAVATLGPGDTVGEMALLDGAPRSATVTANTEIAVLVLTPQTLNELLAIPSVARAVIRDMAARLRRAEGAPEHW